MTTKAEYSVYGIHSTRGVLLYIGMSQDTGRRLQQHKIRGFGKRKISLPAEVVEAIADRLADHRKLCRTGKRMPRKTP